MERSLFVGVGANLTTSCHGPPIGACRWAINRFVSISNVAIECISAFYGSAPIPASDQPDFVNAVVKLSSSIEPAAFLSLLHAIESEAGRVRSEVNAARVLDLDLLAVDDLIYPGPELVLPHPRMHERAFVLFPFCDIAPGWRHPILALTAAELRDRLSPQRIERLP